MNHRMAAVFGVACLASAGCAGHGDSQAADDAPGTLVVARAGGGTLFRAPARGWYCATDSVMAIAAVAADWSGAIAWKSPWPPQDSQYVVGPRFGTRDSARVALRTIPRKDSVGVALLGRSGLLRLRSFTPLSGHFEALVRADSDSIRVVGTFTGVSVDRNGCAEAVAIPSRPAP